VPSPGTTQQAMCQRYCSGLERRGLIPLIADPFVRRLDRAEREDGTAPAVATAEPRKPPQGGAEIRREVEHA
jgi:hypothetical protein